KLGYVMAQQGDIEAAIPHFQKAITLESTNADAYFDLGAAYAALENWRPAVDAFSNAAQLKPGSAEFKGRLAEARAKASGAKK
ncbi:MAG TPA: tetratricopeptide repeat protein, partial [Verrucomicrobiae bacterium]|nr:tetratricopeptide repeat protein [Verrucomicrobiae bacterium]